MSLFRALAEGLGGIWARLAHRPLLQAVIANTGWLMVDRVLRLLLGVLVGAWVARHLGPQRYGELAYVVAFLLMFQALGNLNLDGILVRDISQMPERAPVLLGTALYLRLMASFIAWGAAVLLVAILRPDDHQALLMIGIVGAGMVFQSADIVDLWFQSQMHSRFTVLAKAIGYCLATCVKIALILTDAPLWSFALALLLDMALTASAMLFVYRIFPTKGAWQWSWPLARSMLWEVLPFWMTALAVSAYMRIDQVLLRELAGDSVLGIYSAVLPFSQAWNMLPITAYVSLLPALSTLRLENPAKYRQRLQLIFSLFLWGGVAAAVVTMVFAQYGLHWILGNKYAGSVGVLQVHALSNVFVFIGVAQGLDIVANRTALLGLWKALAGLLTCVIGNSMLIPRYGAMGAAWTAVVSYAVSAMFVNAILSPKIFVMQIRAFFPFYAEKN